MTRSDDTTQAPQGASPLDGANVRIKDGTITLTLMTGDRTALLTVRGKDHDLTSAECRDLARAFDEAAKLTALSTVIGALTRRAPGDEEAQP